MWSEFFKARHLLAYLVLRDLRVRYKRAILGLLWAFLEPLSLMAILTLVFSVFLKLDIPRFPLFALVGVLVWGFLSSSIASAMGCITANAGIIKKIYFPREVIPVSAVLGRFVHFILSLTLLLLLTFPWGVTPTVKLVALPALLLVQLALCLGLALLLSGLSTLYDDVSFLVSFALMIGFYITPVFYSEAMVPPTWRFVYDLNPMAALLQGYRAVILDGAWPAWSRLRDAGLLAALLLAAGAAAFRRLQWRFAESL